MQSHVSTPGNSNIIFLLLGDLHCSPPLTSLMALFSYSLKCLLSYIACVFTCHCLTAADAIAEHHKSKQYYMSSNIRKVILRRAMVVSEFHQLVFHMGAKEKCCYCNFCAPDCSKVLLSWVYRSRMTECFQWDNNKWIWMWEMDKY